jgi:hypothetical protein
MVTMAHTDGDTASQHVHAEATRYAEVNDLPAAFWVLEASAGALDVSQRYADFIEALYRDRKDVTQMLPAAKAGVQYCLEAAERIASSDQAKAEALKNKAKVIGFNAAASIEAWA